MNAGKTLRVKGRKSYSTLYKWYTGLLFLSPWLLGLLVLQIYPFCASIYYSFTDFALVKAPKWVGLQNYITAFKIDPYYWGSLKSTFQYVFMAIPMKMVFALFIAVLLNMKMRAINFFRTVYYLPSILGSSVVIAILWRFIFAKEGVLNLALGALGIVGQNWLGNPKYALFTLSLLHVWQFGSSMVIFLAALKQIPGELYEAARVDGAGPLRTFFSITLPCISPMLLFNIVMQTILAFQDFTSAFVIGNGNGDPLKTTYIYGVMLYKNAFQYLKMGYASAMSWILFIIIVVCTLVIFGTSKYWVFYEDGKGLI